MTRWARQLFRDAGRLVYRTSLNGRDFITQWTELEPSDEPSGYEIRSFTEIDAAVLGQGGAPIRTRSTLRCDSGFRPIRYRSETRDRVWSLDFERDSVVVHPPAGEAEQVVPRGGAEYLVESTGHQAILLFLLRERGGLAQANLKLFAPDALLAATYRLESAPDIGPGWLRSSHEEELHVDEDGRLVECRRPRKGLRTVLLTPPPPLPDGREDEWGGPSRLRYAKPAGARFQIRDVTVEGGVTPIGGALTLPSGRPPFAAVLFLSGSGRHDRHGLAGEIDIGTHEILDHLAEQGVAGLRYDTRGAGSTAYGPDALDTGVDELVEDALACLAFLHSRPEVDPDRIAIIGHSQGALVALHLIAFRNVRPRALVLMASMFRPLDEVMFDQLQSQGEAIGLSDEQIAAQRAELQAFVALARSERPASELDLPDHLQGLLRGRKWLREHLRHPTASLIGSVECPLLVCQGGKDIQVSVQRDAEPLVAAARGAGIDADYALFPNLDHLFKPAAGASRVADYYDANRHVSPEFLDRLTGWLEAHLPPVAPSPR